MSGQHFSLEQVRHKFRYSLNELIRFETHQEVVAQKSKTALILISGFIIYSLLTIIPCLTRHYYHGVVTNICLAIAFALMMVHLLIFKSHTGTTILGVFEVCIILFFHFIMETNWDMGMDAFWLFILVTPFITDYMAGAFFGSIAALNGLLLSLVCFHTPMKGYLQPYGDNMTDWFSVIYIVVMLAAAVIEYELTAYQIDKKVSDEKIAVLQEERTSRLKKQLAIYESNEQTIRKYKHDIRHFNRVLAGYIQNKDYDRAESYLQEFDSMLEQVTAVSFCENTVVNELLTIYTAQCQKMGFKPRIKAMVPTHIPMEEIDLTSLVANALENAVEAQGKLPEGKRAMKVEISYDGRKLKLRTQNPYAVETQFQPNGLPISTREVQSGIGTAQIKYIAEKYGGVASFSQEDGEFVVKAVMTCI